MDEAKKRQALRVFSYGMYILTSRSGDRYVAGTVTWLSQSSFKPPLVMAALRKDASVLKVVSESQIAAIHVLGAGQEEIAQKFFSPTQVQADTINGEAFIEGRTSAPILPSLPAYLECRVDEIVETKGDHAVVILEVIEADCRQQARPLALADTPWEYSG